MSWPLNRTLCLYYLIGCILVCAIVRTEYAYPDEEGSDDDDDDEEESIEEGDRSANWVADEVCL